ncbi:hypothetical protein GQ53DRAFT_807428 [Thozetella sp. PMI_491]|nr:hypothetical protein GQ53DRAFT_807428 [Thozetella sp. PMI_491]
MNLSMTQGHTQGTPGAIGPLKGRDIIIESYLTPESSPCVRRVATAGTQAHQDISSASGRPAFIKTPLGKDNEKMIKDQLVADNKRAIEAIEAEDVARLDGEQAKEMASIVFEI